MNVFLIKQLINSVNYKIQIKNQQIFLQYLMLFIQRQQIKE